MKQETCLVFTIEQVSSGVAQGDGLAALSLRSWLHDRQVYKCGAPWVSRQSCW
jgi:hypothetical protein